jgi:hypothetical protein
MEDDIDLFRGAMEDVAKDLLQRYVTKQEELYVRVEKKLKEIQQAIKVSHAVPTAPSLLETVELGDEPTQLRRLEDAIEAWLQRVQEEKEKAIEVLMKEKEDILEKLRVVRYCETAYENEREELWAMLKEDNAKIQREKDQLFT